MQAFGFDTPNPKLNPPFKWEFPIWPRITLEPEFVKVLVVCDGGISYSTDPYGFSIGVALQDAFDISHDEHPRYARFEFTKAHRHNGVEGVTAGYDNFRFNANSLDDFDELWLFGVEAGDRQNTYLSDDEVEVIHNFMDAGGGVLAMGDHEDLGLGLCAGIKRVRSMRKWWHDGKIPQGMEKAPDSTNLTRNDTVQCPPSGTQDDAIPQPIYPKYYCAYPFWQPWWQCRKYPHQILSGPRGTITVLPDHAHEGDCIIPNAKFASEYPGNVPVEIVAQGRNVIGRHKGGYTICDPREFGLIGVWDGHKPAANQGRVVVDSTWHHWFNLNLKGLRDQGGDNYNDILAYFRNVASWIAPKLKQFAMRRGALRIIWLIPSRVEVLLKMNDFRPDDFYSLGLEARKALGKIASPCQSAAWFSEIVSQFFPEGAINMARRDRFEGVHNLVEAATLEALSTTVFGGVVNAIAIEMNSRGLENWDSWDNEFDSAVKKGGNLGLEAASQQLNKVPINLKALLG
ncbi:MAG: hypothetical protein F6J93_16280 [Oscillatoria sp. SIO1A7]|nr:hypothetical protein [Oscillatoria sp. SIO1A7]